MFSKNHLNSLELHNSLLAVGFSKWKQPTISALFKTYGSVQFSASESAAITNLNNFKLVVCWASKTSDQFITQCNNNNIPVLRLEDGFIRSVGLGAKKTKPLSLCLDLQGIYYDPRKESDHENICANYSFDDSILVQAKKLQKHIIESGISKYNIGSSTEINLPKSKKIILVPGQVEDDASIIYGSPIIKKNNDLLSEVRKENKKAYILYKPHPDTLHAKRQGGIVDDRLYDMLVEDISICDVIDQVHEVHTMTSLAGFEALIRNKKVTTYGLPFYAGWGLTNDKLKCDRRIRKLSLKQLIAATLIVYPVYLHPDTAEICDVEETLNSIKNERGSKYWKLKKKFCKLIKF